ncbi:DNA polymerase III subunit [Solirubrobacter deserti]|uniref:AAA family ATPase n=1 Tax=Solirubrobacter deserti TaxID=2282478 RepID=A0ABT4RP45_9ACTN|nr:AAA family ATPase [Solirubrobacter deserti]MDA0140336.1 AAA family ATPase [Solirubrobacter deserti]
MLALDHHPHAQAVLGAALRDAPAHAYLFHGPAGSGKREIARAFAGELLARDARDPENVKVRAEHGSHPDLTWVIPSGAHEMLRKDVADAVVGAAAHTPFEARHRIFVLERVDVMNDEAANALLKTLEEPPSYVVLILLTDRPTQVLPTIASRCQTVRFDPPTTAQLAERLEHQGFAPDTAQAAARLSLGDGEKAVRLATGDGMKLRAAAESFARAPLNNAVAERPWRALLDRAKQAGADAKQQVERQLAEELQFLPKKEHKRKETEFTERARRADRRAATQALDHALQLAGLWYRDLAVLEAGAPELVFHSDRLGTLQQDAGKPNLRQAQELVEDTRARLILNVSEELACEALAYRLEETFSSSASSA